jgi:hypothetical protein
MGGESLMGQASGFELRHPWLIHNGLLLASVLTYWIDPEDVVWRFIKSALHARLFEYLCFGSAAVLIALGIWLSSWQRTAISTLEATRQQDGAGFSTRPESVRSSPCPASSFL